MLKINKIIRSTVSSVIGIIFLLSQLFGSFSVYAQIAPSTGFFNLPAPGTMIHLTDSFQPPLLKGIKIFPDNPLHIDFIIEKGDSDFQGDDLKQEATKLIKYFLAALTVPQDKLWVNLSPYEENRIIPDTFGQTEMGRDLLAQDYILKQLTSSLIHPDEETGSIFWQKVYEQVEMQFGTSDIPVNTFNKVWIVPDSAGVYANGDRAFVVDTYLKVLNEEDYLALNENTDKVLFSEDQMNEENYHEKSKLSSDLLRNMILPVIEKEVNNGKSFSQLRQIYNAVILATWFKKSLRESLLGRVYVNQDKIEGVDIYDKEMKEKIYQQYLEAFKKGVFDFIKEEYDPLEKEIIPRKYFSGGTILKIEDNFLEQRTVTEAFDTLNTDKAILASVRLDVKKMSESVRAKSDLKIDLEGLDNWVFDAGVDNIIPDEYEYRDSLRKPVEMVTEVIGLKDKVIINLNDGRTMFIGDDHNHAFTYWWSLYRQGVLKEKGNRILHIDAHADARIPKRWSPEADLFLEGTNVAGDIDEHSKNVLGIEGFIAPLAEKGFISQWHWIYNVNVREAVEMERGDNPSYYSANEGKRINPEDMEYDLLDIDIDVLNGFTEKEAEEHLQYFAELAQKAKGISIVTSPSFIEQRLSIKYAKRLAQIILEQEQPMYSDPQSAVLSNRTLPEDLAEQDQKENESDNAMLAEVENLDINVADYEDSIDLLEIWQRTGRRRLANRVRAKEEEKSEADERDGLIVLYMGEKTDPKAILEANRKDGEPPTFIIDVVETDKSVKLKNNGRKLVDSFVERYGEDFVVEAYLFNTRFNWINVFAENGFKEDKALGEAIYVREKGAINNREDTEDHAMLTEERLPASLKETLAVADEKTVGGIDLNTDVINIETSGQSIDFNPVVGGFFIDASQFNGFTPVIFRITPITNLPLILGMNDAETSSAYDQIGYSIP